MCKCAYVCLWGRHSLAAPQCGWSASLTDMDSDCCTLWASLCPASEAAEGETEREGAINIYGGQEAEGENRVGEIEGGER